MVWWAMRQGVTKPAGRATALTAPWPNIALQLTAYSVRFAPRFRQQLKAGVRLQRKEEGRHKTDARKRLCGAAPSGASSRSS